MSEPADRSTSLLQAATERFLHTSRMVADLVSQAGVVGAQAVLPEPVVSSVDRMVRSLRSLVEQAPQLTDELDVLFSELHAKRLTIQAVTAELAALDRQLEVLERTLAPVQTWNRQWGELRRSLLRATEPPADTPE
jgi:hypothetical protein